MHRLYIENNSLAVFFGVGLDLLLGLWLELLLAPHLQNLADEVGIVVYGDI